MNMAPSSAHNDSAGVSQPNQATSGRYVTISVDDGSALDIKTAQMLDKYGLQATFYIPARNPERAVIAPSQIRELSKRFEIGSHTLNHTPLKLLSNGRAAQEIGQGKNWLEDVLGSRVISFCYPRGKFNRATPGLVKNAGFLGGRTMLMNLHDFPRDPFLCGISTVAYSHSRLINIRHALLEGNFIGLRNFFRDYKANTDWREHFTCALDQVEKHGGLAHLVLHSWETDELGEWNRLEEMFAIISKRNFTSVTNGTIFRFSASTAPAVSRAGVSSAISDMAGEKHVSKT